MLGTKDAIKFIRASGDLSEWTDIQIASDIYRAIRECAFTYTTDKDGKLDGICWGRWTEFNNSGPKTLHVGYIRGNLIVFWLFFTGLFPSIEKATGYRHGKVITYKIYAR